MALTISAAGTGSSITGSATLAFDCGASFAVGDMIVVCVAADNAGSGGANSLTSITDAKSHSYSLEPHVTQDPAGANAGQTLAIGSTIVTSSMITTDQITVNFSPNTTSKAATVWKVAPGAGETVAVNGSGSTVGASGTPTITTGTITNGETVIGALAREHNSAVTADSDTSNGSWSAQVTVDANTGTAGTSAQISSQWKTVTATATQTYNLTATSADMAIGYLIVRAVAAVTSRPAVSPARSFQHLLVR